MSALLLALQQHEACAGITEGVCLTLREIACNADSCAVLGRDGAARAVLASLRCHTDAAAVVDAACGALCELATHSDTMNLLLRESAVPLAQELRGRYSASVKCAALCELLEKALLAVGEGRHS